MSSRNNSALASLTATYTDSENEDENDLDGGDSEHTDSSTESQVIIPSRTGTPVKVPSLHSTPTKVVDQFVAAKSALRLVSYQDDTIVSDDDNVSPNHDGAPLEVSEDEKEDEKIEEIVETEEEIEKKKNRFAEFGFTLPEVKGKCPAELQDKITKMYEKMKANNLNMNKVIQGRKEFRNPSIYEKLIQFCDIDEFSTNYPPELYDPMQWGKESYYEELARVQKVEMDKREKDLSKNDLIVVAAKKAEEEAKKRKSKWDQPAPGASVAPPTIQIKSGLLQPSLTTTVTGTKGTVISAFGSLPKKPKV